MLTWRESELAHGRVGMLAAAGFIVQEKFHPLFSGDGGPAVDQIPKLPIFMWFLMTLGIGITEGYRVNLGWSSPAGERHFTDYWLLLHSCCPPEAKIMRFAARHDEPILLTRASLAL